MTTTQSRSDMSEISNADMPRRPIVFLLNDGTWWHTREGAEVRARSTIGVASTPTIHEYVSTDIVESLRAENATFRAAQKACEDCDAPTVAEVESLRARIAELDSRILELVGDWAKCSHENDALRAQIQKGDDTFESVVQGYHEMMQENDSENAALRAELAKAKDLIRSYGKELATAMQLDEVRNLQAQNESLEIQVETLRIALRADTSK
jgi:chromosome segregation ATPase